MLMVNWGLFALRLMNHPNNSYASKIRKTKPTNQKSELNPSNFLPDILFSEIEANLKEIRKRTMI